MGKLKKPPPRSFEESVKILKERSKEETIYIKTLFEVFAGRGVPLLIIILSLPFCQPLQIPGFSTPFGLLIAYLGLRFIFGKRILLPKWILSKPISKKALDKLVFRSLWLLKKIQKFTHERMVFLATNPVMYTINGVLTCLMGLFLALPLPIPLTNIISGWGLLLLNVGLLEDDGLFVLLSYLMAAICIGFFVSIFFLF